MEKTREYVELCVLHHSYSDNGDYKMANKIYKKITKFIDTCKSSESLNDLYPLMFHENPVVRYNASFDLYELYPKESTSTLQQLAEEEPSIGCNASYALEELQNRYPSNK